MSGGSPASVVFRPIPPTLLPAAPVWTSPAVLPLSRKFHFVPVAVASIAKALLPVIIVPIPSFWGPPAVHGLLVLVLPPVPDAVVCLKLGVALGVAGAEGRRREWRVRRMGVVHGVRSVVVH